MRAKAVGIVGAAACDGSLCSQESHTDLVLVLAKRYAQISARVGVLTKLGHRYASLRLELQSKHVVVSCLPQIVTHAQLAPQELRNSITL